MTQNDLMAAIEALPKELQFALAISVLDRLAAESPLAVSEQLKTEFNRREQASLLIRTRAKHGTPCVRSFLEGERRQESVHAVFVLSQVFPKWENCQKRENRPLVPVINTRFHIDVKTTSR